MNHAIKALAFIGNQAFSSHNLRSISCFHSTPVLERRRKNHPVHGRDSKKRYNNYANRMSKINSKKAILHDISDYAEYLFQKSWKEDLFETSTLNDDTSWYRKPYWSRGAKLNGFDSTETRKGRYNKRRGGFNFCASDDEVETIFDSAFSRKGRSNNWSFYSSEKFSYTHYSTRCNTNSWRYETDYEDTDDEEEQKCSPQFSLASERLALGLNCSGPLKLEDVKIAYRACALKWHPDRHQGSSKAAAEEQFKHCSAAYKTLCDKLAV